MFGETEPPKTVPVWESGLRVLEEYSIEFNLYHPETGGVIPVIFTPSIFTNISPLSLKDSDIRLVPASQLIRHEAFSRKGLRKVTFSAEGGYNMPEWNDAPMVGVEDKNGKIMIIDGSTRMGRVQLLSRYVMRVHQPEYTPVFPVQVVDYKDKNLLLDIWEPDHPREKLLTKQQVMKKALAGEFVESKQTKFGVRIGNRVYSIAQTQGEVSVAMSLLLGMNLTSEDIVYQARLLGLLK